MSKARLDPPVVDEKARRQMERDLSTLEPELYDDSGKLFITWNWSGRPVEFSLDIPGPFYRLPISTQHLFRRRLWEQFEQWREAQRNAPDSKPLPK